jgi:hypothetical protein
MVFGLFRVIRIVAAYALAVASSLVLLPLLFAVLSAILPDPGVWIIGAITPALVISLPFIFPFAFLLAVVVTAFPALLAIAVSELRSMRSPGWYNLFGALVAGIAYWQLSPRTIFGLTARGALELLVFALSGAAGGAVYWWIAGRKAGLWRRPAA